MLKYVNTGVVFQEIPDEVTLAVNLSGCPCRCPGCHSRYLWQDVGTPLTPMELERMVRANASGDNVVYASWAAMPTRLMSVCWPDISGESIPGSRWGWYSGRQRVPGGCAQG